MTINIVISSIQIFMLLVSGAYIFRRSYLMKNGAIFFLAMSNFLFGLTLILNDFSDFVPAIVRALLNTNYSITLIIFTHLAFYRNKQHNPSFVLLVIVIILRVIHATFIVLFDFQVPSFVPISEVLLPYYYTQVAVASAVMFLGFFFVAIAALRANFESQKDQVQPWVKIRGNIIGWSYTIFSFTSTLLFFYTTDGQAYAHPVIGLPLAIISGSALLGFSAITSVFWIMPDWLKQRLNAKNKHPALDINAIKDEIPTLMHDALNSYQIIAVVDFLGDKLSKLIHRSAAAAKGLLIISIQKEHGDVGLHTLQANAFKQIIHGSLKTILLTMSVFDVEGIVQKLEDEVVKHQGILFMSSV